MLVKIWGGLGNQMFQYAFARALSEKYQCKVWLDCSAFEINELVTKREYKLDLFNITLPVASQEILKKYKFSTKSKLLNKIYKRLVIKFPKIFRGINFEINFSYDENNTRPCNYYEGYWQSEKYFLSIKEILIKEFTFKDNKFTQNDYLEHVLDTESVSIHVRRGDFINNPLIFKYHGVLTEEYYTHAIKKIREKIHMPTFYIFSDEIEWVRENMFHSIQAYFIKTESAEVDLILMSNCKSNIIANSTFSWWAAYLNVNIQKHVIAPIKWFSNTKDTKDLIPSSWIRI